MIREIVFDTETTGFDPYKGDRIVEIGCVELINHVTTGEVYHQYVNPERDVPEQAFNVHGLNREFLSTYPVFKKVAKDFLDFVGNSVLIAHNAGFDSKFINAELEWAGFKALPKKQYMDTLQIARRKYPGGQNTLDGLCRKFNIDNSNRTKHGALLDSELLAEVYLELIGGREPALVLGADKSNASEKIATAQTGPKTIREPRPHPEIPANEAANHKQFMAEKVKNPIWSQLEAG